MGDITRLRILVTGVLHPIKDLLAVSQIAKYLTVDNECIGPQAAIRVHRLDGALHVVNRRGIGRVVPLVGDRCREIAGERSSVENLTGHAPLSVGQYDIESPPCGHRLRVEVIAVHGGLIVVDGLLVSVPPRSRKTPAQTSTCPARSRHQVHAASLAS